MQKTNSGSPNWLETRKIMVGQTTLLLGEAAIVCLLWGDLRVQEAAVILWVLTHLWAWRQTVWRRQSIIGLIQTLREAATER